MVSDLCHRYFFVGFVFFDAAEKSQAVRVLPVDDGSSNCPAGEYWDGECYDEYPFAKKRYTPAEAAPWLKDNGNVVTLIFKK